MGPPTTELPALPSSVTGHRRTISTSSRSSNNSKRQSTSPPRVSPRSSSLISPPQSMIHASPVAGPSAHHTSPESMSSRPKPPRTPSRHLLQTALDLAQRAVEMDKSNDVLGALAAYREAVARLKNVMERVGVDPTDGRRRKSSGRAEEEGRTLRGIVCGLDRIPLTCSTTRMWLGSSYCRPMRMSRMGSWIMGSRTTTMSPFHHMLLPPPRRWYLRRRAPEQID